MWRHQAYFRLFRHVTLNLVRWASNAKAAIGIFPNKAPKEMTIHCTTTEKQLQSINLHKTV